MSIKLFQHVAFFIKTDNKLKKILILGGGFAGLESAISASKMGFEVTLVSNRDFMFVYPISIWIPVNKLRFEDAKLDLNKLASIHKFKFRIGNIEHIDHYANYVTISGEPVHYDYLIIALGMDKMKTAGGQNTTTICGLPNETLILKEKLDRLVEKESGTIAVGFGGNPLDPTSTAVRGGPAFEMLFNISHYLSKIGMRKKFKLIFFSPMAEPGRKMGEKPYSKLDGFFKHYGITKHVGKKITSFSPGAVNFADGSNVEADLIIYIEAGSGNEIVARSGLPTNEAGFIITDEGCRVIGHQNIFAVGDVAALMGPKWAAKQGHIAEVMAQTAVHNIAHDQGLTKSSKSYIGHLSIVCVMDSGDGAAFINRTHDSERFVSLPIIGHWLKKGWGFYFKHSKLKHIPRIPGM